MSPSEQKETTKERWGGGPRCAKMVWNIYKYIIYTHIHRYIHTYIGQE